VIVIGGGGGGYDDKDEIMFETGHAGDGGDSSFIDLYALGGKGGTSTIGRLFLYSSQFWYQNNTGGWLLMMQ